MTGSAYTAGCYAMKQRVNHKIRRGDINRVEIPRTSKLSGAIPTSSCVSRSAVSRKGLCAFMGASGERDLSG